MINLRQQCNPVSDDLCSCGLPHLEAFSTDAGDFFCADCAEHLCDLCESQEAEHAHWDTHFCPDCFEQVTADRYGYFEEN